MPITVPCVRCKTKFQVPSKLAGQTVRCQACGSMMRLPSPEKIQAKKRAARTGKTGAAGAAATRTPAPAGLTQDDLLPDDLLQPFDEAPAAPHSTAGNAPTDLSAEPAVLSCSHCEGLLYYDPNFANQTVACPHCGNHLMMPEL